MYRCACIGSGFTASGGGRISSDPFNIPAFFRMESGALSEAQAAERPCRIHLQLAQRLPNNCKYMNMSAKVVFAQS
jgi:hypothetical protein